MKHTLKTLALGAIAGLSLGSTAQAQEPFLGDVLLFGGTFCPAPWYVGAHGQLLPIAQNQALYSLIGTQYGGDGRTTFALPDLRGAVPVHVGTGPGLPTVIPSPGFGRETTNLLTQHLPSHTHNVRASTNEMNTTSPDNALVGSYPAGTNFFTTDTPNTNMAGNMVATTGNSQSVNLMAPSLGIQYCIAIQGLFPSRN